MIISLRGTHGSGKSEAVRRIVQTYHAEEDMDADGKILGYVVDIPTLDRPLLVIGSYKNACGGCDGIQPYGLIWPRVVSYAQLGHVLFEGAMVSSSYGNIGRASIIYGDNMVFAFLDTPLEVCLERLAARRLARGDKRPLDPKNTIGKYRNVLTSITKIREVYKRRVIMIDHRKAVSQLLGILHGTT